MNIFYDSILSSTIFEGGRNGEYKNDLWIELNAYLAYINKCLTYFYTVPVFFSATLNLIPQLLMQSIKWLLCSPDIV